VTDLIAEELLKRDRKRGLKNANQEARNIRDDTWNTTEGILSVVPGKKIVSKLSGWSKEKYGVSFSASKIARGIREDEIQEEMRGVITAIETRISFASS